MQVLVEAGFFTEYLSRRAIGESGKNAGRAFDLRCRALIQTTFPKMTDAAKGVLRVKMTSHQAILAVFEGTAFAYLISAKPNVHAKLSDRIEENFALLVAHLGDAPPDHAANSEFVVALSLLELLSFAVQTTAASSVDSAAIGIPTLGVAVITGAAIAVAGRGNAQALTVGSPREGDDCVSCALLPREWEAFNCALTASYAPRPEPDFVHRNWVSTGVHYASVESDSKVAYGASAPCMFIPSSDEAATLAARLAWSRIFGGNHTTLVGPGRVFHKLDPRDYPPTAVVSQGHR